MSKTQYDDVADVYYSERNDKNNFNYNRDIEIPSMLRTIGDVKNKLILDIGCGFGDHAELYSREGAKVIGVDVSKKLIDIAKSRKIKNCDFRILSLEKKMPFKNNSFNIVSASLVVHYVKKFDLLLKEINRVLKKGGIFIFSTGNPVFDSIVTEKIKGGTLKIIGFKKYNNNKNALKIFGDYFNEKKRTYQLGFKEVNVYKRTYQTIIQSLIKNDFLLIDYVDCKPVPSSKNLSKTHYLRTSRLPSFCIFKCIKK